MPSVQTIVFQLQIILFGSPFPWIQITHSLALLRIEENRERGRVERERRVKRETGTVGWERDNGIPTVNRCSEPGEHCLETQSPWIYGLAPRE